MPPTLLRVPAVLDALVAEVRKGTPASTAARALGIAPQTLSDWLTAAQSPDPSPKLGDDLQPVIADLAERIARARAEHEAEMVQAVVTAATVANEKTGIPDWRAGAWYLNNAPHTRQTYRQHREVEVHNTGTISHEHQLVRDYSDAELEAQLQAVEQQSLPTATR